MIKVILASKSPRRKEILERIGVSFKTIPSHWDEILSENENPQDAVIRIARGKALSVSRKLIDIKNTLIIGADTIVYLDKKIIGQPKDEEEAKSMLQILQGRTHIVYTGISLLKNGEDEAEGYSESFVEFYPMTEEEIEWYVKSKEPLDKAGAYGAQGKGALFIKKIDGSFHNVMGFPVDLFHLLLKKLNLKISQIC